MYTSAMSIVLAPNAFEDAIYDRASRLLAVQHAVAEICGGKRMDADPQALKEAVMSVRKIVKSIDGAYATFIGGLAVQHLGYERWTDDVDVVVDQEHYSEILERLRAIGFRITADFALQHKDTGAKLDLLREGITLKDAKYPLPHPRELGPNIGFATLPSIVRLKLDAHRMQDFADIVSLLKPRLAEIASIRASLPDDMHAQFDLLVIEARREMGA